MREQNKKSKSRKMFEAVFDQQARRFSAFDLLGLTAESTTAPDILPSRNSSQKNPQEPRTEDHEKQPKYDHRFIPKTPNRPQTSASDQKELPGLLKALGTDGLLPTPATGEETDRGEKTPRLEALQLLEQKSTNQADDGEKLYDEIPGLNEAALHDYHIQEDDENSDLDGQKRSDENNSKDTKISSNLRQSLGADRLPPVLGVDPQYWGQTLPSSWGQTPSNHWGQTPPGWGQTSAENSTNKLGADRLSLVKKEPVTTLIIPLAPLQWRVWIALQNLETENKITSYRDLADITKTTIKGARKAVIAIEKEGGIIGKQIVRSTRHQGFRFTLNKTIPFRKGSLSETKALQRRGSHKALGADRLSLALGADGLRMYVGSFHIEKKHTDVVRLLKLTPESWKIREQTLIQIAELLPEMTAIEFRLSLSYLVEQAKQTKEPIRNPNAWLKAAFEKNQAPLITERDIEARFGRKDRNRADNVTQPPTPFSEANIDSALLRFYLGSSAEVRAEIDRIAEQKAAPLLKVVTAEHRTGILAEARLEAVREFFSKKGEQVSE